MSKVILLAVLCIVLFGLVAECKQKINKYRLTSSEAADHITHITGWNVFNDFFNKRFVYDTEVAIIGSGLIVDVYDNRVCACSSIDKSGYFNLCDYTFGLVPPIGPEGAVSFFHGLAYYRTQGYDMIYISDDTYESPTPQAIFFRGPYSLSEHLQSRVVKASSVNDDDNNKKRNIPDQIDNEDKISSGFDYLYLVTGYDPTMFIERCYAEVLGLPVSCKGISKEDSTSRDSAPPALVIADAFANGWTLFEIGHNEENTVLSFTFTRPSSSSKKNIFKKIPAEKNPLP
eukprot:TRINITY_DN10893_c0_g1_i1.p1 TRINITY_DN10893_c0_g1~~TRINITY_DN10893_c0_g1_i1.p1  ORF type:complete len:297 (-),score=23.87 TRINITY_DN10893_c0_g1_i1:65-925(-)